MMCMQRRNGNSFDPLQSILSWQWQRCFTIPIFVLVYSNLWFSFFSDFWREKNRLFRITLGRSVCTLHDSNVSTLKWNPSSRFKRQYYCKVQKFHSKVWFRLMPFLLPPREKMKQRKESSQLNLSIVLKKIPRLNGLNFIRTQSAHNKVYKFKWNQLLLKAFPFTPEIKKIMDQQWFWWSETKSIFYQCKLFSFFFNFEFLQYYTKMN